MTNVVQLQTRAQGQHVAVRASGRAWAVVLVTPIDGSRPLRTTLARFSCADVAAGYGEHVAAKLRRPFKAGRATQ